MINFYKDVLARNNNENFEAYVEIGAKAYALRLETVEVQGREFRKWKIEQN